MSLIEKFAAIKVEETSRISESDQLFCEGCQAAYEDALDQLKQFITLRTKAEKRQEELLAVANGLRNESYSFLMGVVDADKLFDCLKEKHKDFVNHIVAYFSSVYKVSLDRFKISELLIPAAPQYNYWDRAKDEAIAAQKKYDDEMMSLKVNYKDIINLIFKQLGYSSFEDAALREVKAKAYVAAHNYRGDPNYEVKKNVLRFPNYAVSVDSWRDQYEYGDIFSLPQGTKDILIALSHYLTGRTEITWSPFSAVFAYHFPAGLTCSWPSEKYDGIKYFKNGRLDIKFTSETYAREFVAEYLEAVSSAA